jgi:hypothetical protein
MVVAVVAACHGQMLTSRKAEWELEMSPFTWVADIVKEEGCDVCGGSGDENVTVLDE